MAFNSAISLVFTAFYILVIIFFILRALSLMSRDNKYREHEKLNKKNSKSFGLLVLDPGANRGLNRGDLIHLKSGLTIGRNEDNSIVMVDPYISNYHTRFFVHNGRFVIEDLNSKNGTLLNKDRLLRKTYLRLDDIITIGTAIFRVVGR